jgi:PAS domain S-box-containing protein
MAEKNQNIKNQEKIHINEIYSRITKSIRQGIIWIDEKGKILRSNEQFFKDLGYNTNEARPSTIFEVNPFLNLLSWREAWKELCTKGEINLQTQHINVEGVIHPAFINGILLTVDSKKICLGIIDNKSKNRARQLLELTSSITHTGSWQHDVVKKQWIYTDEIFRLLCIPRDNEQKSLIDLLQTVMSPLEHSTLVQNFAEIKVSGESFVQEFGLPDGKQNEFKYLRLTAVAEKGVEDILSIYGTIQGVSGRNVRTLEMYLAKHSVDNGHEEMAWIDKKGNIVYMNQAYKKLTGYTQNEKVRLNIYDVNHEMDEEGWKALWISMKSEKKSIIETFHYTKNGDKIPVEVYTNFLTFEGEEYICAFLRNMSERQVKTRPQRLAQITLEHNPMMVLWVEESGKIIYANQAACRQLEYEKTELVGKNITDTSTSYPDIRMWKARWRIMKEEEGNAYEETQITKSGRVIPVEVSRHYIDYEGEEFICVFLKDITERKIQESKIEGNLHKSLTQRAQLTKEIKVLRNEMKTKSSLSSIVTNSNNYMQVLAEVRRVAETNATVLITGETGTGKELLAKAVHELSERSDKTFIKVNAAVIPENLFESELFGHEKGSFTGAIQARQGRFESADGGTIFLDEIGEMAIGLQAKLLRVLQEGEFERVGGTKTLKVDVRVVAATNRDLEQMVNDGKFREDLYYRLNVFPIHNLPLRERIEDVPFLVKFFLKKYARKIGKAVKEVSAADLKDLMKYNFPGNVRELENMVERAIILSSGQSLNLSAVLKAEKKKSRKKVNLNQTLDEVQRLHIIKTIKMCGGRISGKNGAALILGMKDKTLYSRIKKLGIEKSEYII